MPSPHTHQLALHLRQVFFGGNWTFSNLRDQLTDVDWQMATQKREGFNSIAILTFHIGYFISAALPVLQGGPLDAHDKYSFDHPPILGPADWQTMQDKLWTEVESLAIAIEALPEDTLYQDFTDPKYGSYYRNILGIIEHSHYHLGQIAILKKLLTQAPA